MTLTPGTRLGPYEIVAQIGAGGMGEVYRARDPRLGREVAIKVLPAGVTQDAERRNRFEQEARAASALNHPNIISIFDIGSQDGVLYVVQELLEGQTLRERLKAGPVPARKATDYAVQVTRGLAAAHEKGIVHRDLKPENLFLIRDGRVKILDFGLAKLVQVKASAVEATSAPTEALGTQPGVVMGTVGYMSPEQVRGQAVDHRSDIFSFGAILYEALTGKRAFQAGSAVETMSAILSGDPPELTRANPNVPPAMERIVRHCLEKNPEERFYSARDLAFDLESLSSVSAPAAAATPAVVRRKWVPVAVVAALALVAGALVSRVLFPSRGIALSAYRFTAFATEQGYKTSPAWSPDGKTIAYAQTVDGVSQIFTRGLAQATPAQLTKSPSDCTEPFWSPDGARIFYAAVSKGTRDIWTVGAAGGEPNRVVQGIAAATISPDGKTLAFLRRGEGDVLELWVASPPDGQARKFSQGLPKVIGYANVYPRFSPDGSRIGISLAVGEKKCEFWTVTSDTGEARRVFRATSTFGYPRALPFHWFPDNRYVVFSGALTQEVSDHLMVADTQSGDIRPLTATFRGEGYPSISPSATSIAFTSDAEDADIVEIPLDGSPMRSMLATSGQEHCAAWSPVGHQFAYSRNQGGADEIWLRNPQEGWERPLVTRDRFTDGQTDRVSEVRFSPDAQRIAFVRVAGGQYRVWIASVAGGPPVPLTQTERRQMVPAWSSDGNWIAFFFGSLGGDATLAKANAGGGGQPIVLKTPGQSLVTRTQWSPRGDWLIWVATDGLYVVAADGNRSELVSVERGWQSYGFSKDGAAVLGVRLGLGHHWLVCSVDIASKKERIISDLGTLGDVATFHAFSLAPDGKSFLTSVVHQKGDIWILEGYPKPAQLFRRWWR